MIEKMNCPNCNGKRFLMALGGFKKECDYCNGSGRIEITKGDDQEGLKSDEKKVEETESKSVTKKKKTKSIRKKIKRKK